MYPIKPKYNIPDNRQHRRKVFAERDYLLETIWDFEHSFGLDLFHPELDLSYRQIYESYARGWIDLLKKLKAKKLKYFNIDEYYFQKNYKPIEKCWN